jgi:hypothetical protein
MAFLCRHERDHFLLSFYDKLVEVYGNSMTEVISRDAIRRVEMMAAESAFGFGAVIAPTAG